MRRVAKIFGWIFLFYLLFIIFIPKVSLYYQAERILKDSKIIIDNEKVVDKFLFLKITNAQILYDDISSAEIDEVSLFPLLVYNVAVIKDIKLNNSFKDFFPTLIKKATISYGIWSYYKIFLNSNGEFGEVKVVFDITKSKIAVLLKASSLMKKKYKKLLKKMKFIKNKGVYVYEHTLK